MIILDIPGYETIQVKSVTFDFNGTLAADGILVPGVSERLVKLANLANIYILTANTFGTAGDQCRDLPVKMEIFSNANISEKKMNFVEKIGPETTIAIGNGRNDRLMFEKSALSIIVMGKEGCYIKSMLTADIIVNNPIDAIDLLLKSDRIVATLRT
ncbi:HAD family hydrolase [Acetobacterium bakii]|uniref:ATPase P n=1 Tax=Acetobacterium bakii TaxID=52689 RepID=A0A0L6U1A5_9FIRM|nr:HAD family hydrolase [Acetobacterium bakii]KNZ41585.1 ATPase P [Acetobacterium bakii]